MNTFKRRKLLESFFKWVAIIFTWSTVLLLIVLLFHISKAGFEYFDWQFLNSFPSRRAERAGIKAGIWGTVFLITLTGMLAIPIGIATAIYLEEYTKKGKIGKIVEINIANLAGVPSIVYGLLGLSVFVRYFKFDRSLLAGALTLALLILPVIIIATKEAIKDVPKSIKLAAYAMGATTWQVIWGQTLPAAMPGILTGVILSLSRAVGETAPLIVVGALAYVSFIPESIMDEFTVMPIQIYNWAGRPQESFHHLAASGIIILLIIMLSMNFVAIWIRHKFSKGKKS